MIKKSKYHNVLVKFLKENLKNKNKIVPAQGVMILNIGKWCKSQLELIEETESQRQYKIAIYHVIQMGKAFKKQKK